MLDAIHFFLMGIPDFFVIIVFQLLGIYASSFTTKQIITIVQYGNHVPFLIPFLAIAFVPAMLIYGTLRVAMQREMEEGYVRTAQSKGLGLARILFAHVSRNVIEDLLTVMPRVITLALGNMVMAEVVCSITGLGGYMIHPYSEDISSLPLTCCLLGIFALVLHGIIALLRKLLVVRTKEAN